MFVKLRNFAVPLIKNNFNISAAYLSSTPAAVLKEERIKIDKWEINFVKSGHGPHHVFCLPGALGTIWTDFKPQIEGFNKDKFTLVVWDPPGYGKSRPPQRDFPVDLYEKDATYAYEFMKALNIPKYSVLGWSDGGITGLILAAKYPKVVEKLVVTGTNSFIIPNELETYKKIKDTNSWSKRMKQPMVDVYGEENFANYWKSWVEGMEALYKARNGNICRECLPDIKCPTFIIHGEKDPMVDLFHVTHLHTNIVGARLHLYPEGKHNVHIKYAEDFNQRVQEFLLLQH